MKRILLKATVVLVLLGIAGFLVAASGIIPIKASSGHWPITAWFLRFGMHRSFATHSLGVDVPKLDDPGLILKGATHYDFGCRSCHGSPGAHQPRIGQSMTPPAPNLSPLIASWKPEQLFTLVKHGVKFTGMPAWPSQQRDDEVWAMVAFLRKLPELDATAYQQLVHGPPEPTAAIEMLSPADKAPQLPSSAIQSCVRCHGSDGLGRGSDVFPKLAGQRQAYLENALLAYARGTRHSGIMEPIAAGLTPEVLSEVARYYSQLPPPAGTPPARTAANALEPGKRIAREGIPDRRVPSCVECHEPAGRRAKPEYPLLAGQPAEYLVLQLELFKKDLRGGSAYAHLMEHVAPYLSRAEMEAVAAYFAAQSPEPARGGGADQHGQR